MSRLVLRYRYDPSFFDPEQYTDDFGLLSVVVETDGFSGKGSMWIQWQDVVEFGQALHTFPIREDQPIAVECGYNELQGNSLILRIAIFPVNKTGDLKVQFVVADYLEPENRVAGFFLTNYPNIESFGDGVACLMNLEAEEAVLTGR